MKKPDPKPCRCGCGQIVMPKRTSCRGDWSVAKFYSDQCRNEYRSQVTSAINRGEMKAKHKLTAEREKSHEGPWKIHPIVDRFIYAKPGAI